MKKIIYISICTLIINLTYSQSQNNFSKNEIIIKFKQNSGLSCRDCFTNKSFNNKTLDSLNTIFQLEKIKLVGNIRKSDTYVLSFQSKVNINRIVNLYLNTNLFEFVEPNYIGKGGGQKNQSQKVLNDTYFSRQWGLHNNGTFKLSPSKIGADINMELAWDIEQGNSSIIVAVLDSGAKLDHPEFMGRIWENSNEILDGIDNDNNGFIDDINGWDFANNDQNPTDDYGHGTNVAGIIGANGNNNKGYTGVDLNCKLMICKVLDQNNYGYYSWWIDAIYYAVDNGAKVINMSIGGDFNSSLLETAINYAYDHSVTVVACMMNYNNNKIYYPAGFKNTIAVGSTNPNDERSSPFFWSPTSGSNYGQHIDVVAPGNYIYGLNYNSNTNYDSYWGGTSQATPLVTGLSALLLAQNSSRTPDEIREIITKTAKDQVGKVTEDVEGFDIYYGYGRINAYQALLKSNLNTSNINLDNSYLTIYPNPVSNYLYIKSINKLNKINIVNLLGQEVYLNNSLQDQNNLEINIENIPKGIYFLNIFNDNQKNIQTKKIIKK